MPREFRRVPRNWEHPRVTTQDEADCLTRAYFGTFAVGDYIPLARSRCRRGVAYQWYESTTEGTPLSPVCPTLEDMARWWLEHEGQEPARRRAPAGGWEEEPWTLESVRAYIQQDVW